ncbi:spore germination protein GerW family protein [Egicoccus sp. AB-alg2]|uniref:spore germination protein GerW family protein n=1 Tax=Egicoccus sp. AB-alg2 TaxID=3242693 RepID=UPI00359EA5DD
MSNEADMKVDEVLHAAQDTLTVRRVYGEPLQQDGLTVIPAAAVAGGGGGGGGHDNEGQEGEGGGFGMAAKPVGAFVISQGRLTWQPAVDVNRLLGTVATVLCIALLTSRRGRRRRREAGSSEAARWRRRAS